MMTTMAVCIALGALCWTFLEYALHGWAFHRKGGTDPGKREHMLHHADNQYFAPWYKKLLLAVVILSILATAASAVFGWVIGTTFMTSIVGAWLFYERVHRRLHTHAPHGPVGRYLRRHHFAHHFANPNRNLGVTSPVWDKLLGTYVAPGVVLVPAKQVAGMPWLVESSDPLTVAEAYARDYRIIGGPKPHQGDRQDAGDVMGPPAHPTHALQAF